jgi:acyl-CoA synthetase (AMP-forming)/AMP-acid ligase II/acyl carrier protein
MVPASTSPSTLIELLWRRLAESPARELYRFFAEGGTERVHELSVEDLARRARAVASALHACTRPGDRILLVCPPGLDFVPALFGCLVAGRIAVPAPLPDRDRPDVGRLRLRSIAEDASVAAVLGVSGTERTSSDVLDRATWLAVDELPDAPAGPRSDDPVVAPGDVAWLQYTSGSTGSPRGVIVTHANVLANCEEIALAYTFGSDSVLVSWVPTHHDLGLVYAVVMPLFAGFQAVLTSPLSFVQRPARWMQIASQVGATHTIAPNFGFDLAAARTTAADRAGLDLSRLGTLLNGGEPIRRASEARFAELYAGCGLAHGALSHSYGMSETTAKITAEHAGHRGRFAWLDAQALERGFVRDAASRDRGTAVAGNGTVAGSARLAIVDAESNTLAAPDQVGEVWVCGPSVGRGYWNRPNDTAEVFEASLVGGPDTRWLRTGDLGFVRNGELYVTGRQKDLVIVRGENHHPHDIEWSVDGSHPALRPGSPVAFAVDVSDGEALGVVVEVYPDRLRDPEEVFGAVRDAVGRHGLSAAVLALVPPGGLAKTSSGKRQRQLVRRELAAGTLPVLARFDAAAADRAVLDGVDLPAVVRSARPTDRAAVLLLHTRHLVAGLVGLRLGEVDGHRPLKELGLDSITQIEMVEQLGTRLGIELPGSTVRDFPTLSGIAGAAVALMDVE